jgi:hypothetical protein
MRFPYIIRILTLASGLLLACGEPNVNHGQVDGGNGGGGGGGGGGTGGGGGGGGGIPQCGVQDFMLVKGGPADLIIVQDRSGSMTDSVTLPGGGTSTRWKQIVPAIESTVQQVMSVNWGLSMFANDGFCGVETVPSVPPAPGTGMQIKTTLDAVLMPDSSTPTAAAIHSMVAYYQTLSDGNPHYLLLATDGEPNCGGDAVQEVTDAATAGIHTFVVGIAGGAGDQTLTDMANAGKEPNTTGTHAYYEATTTADLVNVLSKVAGQLVSCTFALQKAPDHPDLVEIQGNGMVIPRDKTHMNGWDFGPNNMSIIFYGSACSALQMGTITMVKAIYACPPPG